MMNEEVSIPNAEQAIVRGAFCQKTLLCSKTKVFTAGHIKVSLFTQVLTIQMSEVITKVIQAEGFANNGFHHEWGLSDLVSPAVEAEQRYAQAIEMLEAAPSTELYDEVWLKLTELSLFI